MKFKRILPFVLLLICSMLALNNVLAQDTPSSDELFIQARSAAFDNKDYHLAIELSKRALAISPAYLDIRIFLGRVYTWSGKLDSARTCFEEALKQKPDYEDASSAYADLEYWNDNPTKALAICDSGLHYHPDSRILQLKKAKSLAALTRYVEASTITTNLLVADPKDSEARTLAQSIAEMASVNKIGFRYDYVGFDRQFANAWHIAAIQYSHGGKAGSIIGRFNYGYRFQTSAAQLEVDAYPRISKTFYSYVNAGFSDSTGVFPKYRAGFSLYANLPKSFEADAGFRYLYFSNATWIYTGSIGKYYKSYWFNFRTYITPGNSNISQSFAFTTRYYFGGVDDYLHLLLSTGLSPDDRTNNVQLNNVYKLKSKGVTIGYNKSIKKKNILFVNFAYTHQEYLPKTFGNQYNLAVGFQRRF